ncbi:N-alpha-acetyltransferase 15, NatA auxiliary subunit [Kappamyces sp. JEL0680]|nr:N-alpha-acetyltransferase 15, NatA auxiliary subunit [Kappamyces sp. JEL0680]
MQRLPLSYAEGKPFYTLVDAYLIKMFRKGVPSLFNSFNDLLRNAAKAEVILELVEGYHRSLSVSGKINEDGSDKEAPTVHLWVMYFLAQFYDFAGNSTKALELIDAAIEHSPTVVELYMVKAAIFKNAGDSASAMAEMDRARCLDLQDRYVNSECTRYMLLNNDTARAESTIALFAKESSAADPDEDLNTLQCSWYSYCTGVAHQNQLKFGLALKRFKQVYNHFLEFMDDQLDFHPYAVRKQTLRSYLDVIASFSTIQAHRFFVQAAKAAITTHLTVFEGGPAAEQMVDGVSLIEHSAAERKKILSKARKAEAKSHSNSNSNSNVAGAAAAKKNEDPFGTKFVVDADHLAESLKYLKPLLAHCPNDLDVLELACRLYTAKSKRTRLMVEKYLIVLQYVAKAATLDPKAPFIHYYASKVVFLLPEVADINVAAVIRAKAQTFLGQGDSAAQLAANNEPLLQSDDPQTVLWSLRLAFLLNPSVYPASLNSISKRLLSRMDIEVGGLRTDPQTGQQIIRIIGKDFQQDHVVAEWKSQLHSKFAYATAFHP